MSYMIDILIDYQKTVVSLVVLVQSHTGILSIMPFYILAKLLRNLSVVNINGHTGFTFRQLYQYRIIYITVNDNNPTLSLTYKSGDENIGIKYLTVKKNSLYWFLGFIQTIKYSIHFLVCLQLFHFNPFHSMENGSIVNKKVSHRHKSVDNTDARGDCGLTFQYC